MNNLATEYEHDFHAWIQQHIALLKQGKVNEIDIEHLILELEDMGKSNVRELESRLIVLIAHLLKWQFQLSKRSNNWSDSIDEQRVRLSHLLESVPSIKRNFSDATIAAYPKAVKLAVKETKLPLATFPNECLYSIEQLLDDDFYP